MSYVTIRSKACSEDAIRRVSCWVHTAAVPVGVVAPAFERELQVD